MAKSDFTTFESIVQAIPAIASAYRDGLQALDFVIVYCEKDYFVEVNTANTSNFDEVVKKKNWLEVWLNANASDLKAMMAGTSYYWIASGKVAILPNSPQARRIAKNKLVLCKELKLDTK